MERHHVHKHTNSSMDYKGEFVWRVLEEYRTMGEVYFLQDLKYASVHKPHHENHSRIKLWDDLIVYIGTCMTHYKEIQFPLREIMEEYLADPTSINTQHVMHLFHEVHGIYQTYTQYIQKAWEQINKHEYRHHDIQYS
jgi:hypothetical protein